MELQHLHLKSSSAGHHNAPAIDTTNQIQSLASPSRLSSSMSSTPSLKHHSPSSKLQTTRSFRPPSFIHQQGSIISAEKSLSGTTNRSRDHYSRECKTGHGKLLLPDDTKSPAQPMHTAKYVVGRSSGSRKSSNSKSSGQKSRKSVKTSSSFDDPDLVLPSSISIPGSSHCTSIPDRPEGESASHPYQHRRNTSNEGKKETTSITSKGTSTLYREVDELIDGATSEMRVFDAHIAAVGNSDDKGGGRC
jgi:hypothetical protein